MVRGACVCGWTVIAVVLAGLSRAATPFDIQLSGSSGTWLPAGSVIRIPVGAYKEFTIRLASPSSRQYTLDQLEISLDGRYPLPVRLTGAEGHFLRVTTREVQGLFPTESHRLLVSANGRVKLSGSWTIIRWDRPYIESVGAGRGAPIQIRLDRPASGLVVLDSSRRVRIAGQVAGQDDVRLTLDGAVVSRVPDKPGFRFDKEIVLAGTAKEAVLRAVDGSGAETILVLQICATEPD